MSKNPEHIKENMNIFDFKLTKEEVEKINGLKKQLLFTEDFEKACKGCERYKVSLTD